MIKQNFVLDCSVTMTWCFSDEATHYTRAVRDSLIEVTAVVPSLWPLEIANVLWGAECKKRISQLQSTRFLDMLESCPIIIDDAAPRLARTSILELARIHTITVYDAAYLELAIREQLPLATLDKLLLQAAKTEHIALYEPTPP